MERRAVMIRVFTLLGDKIKGKSYLGVDLQLTEEGRGARSRVNESTRRVERRSKVISAAFARPKNFIFHENYPRDRGLLCPKQLRVEEEEEFGAYRERSERCFSLSEF